MMRLSIAREMFFLNLEMVLQAAALSQLHDGIEVGVMAVDAAVGQQADEMEGLAVVQRVVDGV